MSQNAEVERLLKLARNARLFAVRDIRDICASLARLADDIEAGESINDRLMDRGRNLVQIAADVRAAEAAFAIANAAGIPKP